MPRERNVFDQMQGYMTHVAQASRETRALFKGIRYVRWEGPALHLRTLGSRQVGP